MTQPPSHWVSPDAERLRGFADRINRAQRPLLVLGPEVDRSGAWDAGVAFAQKVGAPVYSGPLPDRVSFPEDHPLYQGQLPMTIAGVTEVLQGHDLVVVIGAQVFRYYPHVPGEYLPVGTALLEKRPVCRAWTCLVSKSRFRARTSCCDSSR